MLGVRHHAQSYVLGLVSIRSADPETDLTVRLGAVYLRIRRGIWPAVGDAHDQADETGAVHQRNRHVIADADAALQHLADENDDRQACLVRLRDLEPEHHSPPSPNERA